MTEDDVVDFIRSGQFIGVSLGDGRNEVISIFGEPEFELKNSEANSILKYHSLEIELLHNKVASINLIYYSDKFKFSDNILNSSVNGKLNVDELITILDGQNIGWAIYNKYSAVRDLCIITQSDVMLFYDFGTHELDKIQLSMFDCGGYNSIYD